MAEPRMKYGAWMVVFLAAGGTTAHKQALIDGGLVPLLINMAAGGETEEAVKDMAAISVGNIALGGSQQQVEHVVECGGIQYFCDRLDGDDSQRLSAMISVLDKILSAGEQKQATEGLPDNPYCTLVDQAGGVDKIVELQAHNDMAIAAPAVLFLGTHFPDRVDGQRREALIQAGAIQIDDEQGGEDGDSESDGVGDLDTDSGSDGRSDGEVEVEVEGEEA
ncbi:unnamed protein product [Vitrella brassicaformis CCMP3155]|uniref:Armadillo repeat-containing domain-containing protein n=1 Tax=Vitrella brassicaformis (strain CCMP3155) TaxID=1169540 RepID=A0A0G4FKE6_VITBC|nr:unnamed protein product [Vitrella brassicaformis CCMP3155]|eukprot:CEM14192.1 unnamed protein product [Vitrella brassicaformis CCMP3155]